MSDPTQQPNQQPAREQTPDADASTTPPQAPAGGSFTPSEPGMAPPPPMQAPSGVGQPADLMNRFLARLIDMVLLAVVNGILVGGVVVGMLMNASNVPGTGFAMSTGTGYAATAVSSILSTLIVLGYFVFLESSRGQTVGKMLLKLETRGPGGGRPTVQQALKRNAFLAIGLLGIVPFLNFVSGLLSLAAYILIAVSINNNKTTRQGWHDEFAGGTSVVKIG